MEKRNPRRESALLRSQHWFDNPNNPGQSGQYIERYMNWGLSRSELQSGKPIIGIAQTGSDLVPCNRHHLDLAHRTREGIREAGGIAFEFPVHPIQESGKRPTAALDRNLAYLGLVEVLYGYPLDGVVLTTGCDKTTPAQLMGAATVNIPAIVLSGGPMLNGWYKGERMGSGAIVWRGREMVATGEITEAEYVEMVSNAAPSPGHCNTMGTASTLNSLAEAVGMSLPGSAAIPAVHRDRAEMAYLTGRRIVEMVREDLKPSDIMTREAFENAVVVNSAIGGSTNAPIHFNAIARHMGVSLNVKDWEERGFHIPLLVNLQPAGKYLGEEFHRAGGVPAVVRELMKHGLINEEAVTVTGLSIAANCRTAQNEDSDVIRSFDNALLKDAGFRVLSGNIFESAIMKTSGISEEFSEQHLRDARRPNSFEGRAVVFEGPEDYRNRIDDQDLNIDEGCILFIRGVGPYAYPGSAEVVNMQPPAEMMRRGIYALPCVGDGRQSGTSDSPSILNASPEAAAGGGLAIVRTGDTVRIDLNLGEANLILTDEEIESRYDVLAKEGPWPVPISQTPWQEMQRSMTGQLSSGMVLEPAIKYQRIAQTMGIPRDSAIVPIAMTRESKECD